MGAKKKTAVGPNEAAAQAALAGVHKRVRRRPVSPEVAKRLAANKAKAEVRCMLCGHEVVMRAPSTSEVIRLLRDRCVREGWRTVLLPKGGRQASTFPRGRVGTRAYGRRLMVCPRCAKQLRPVSKSKPPFRAIACDTWGS